MTAILDFTRNAKSKVFFDHTTLSGMPVNRKVDTKITSLLPFCRKWHQFIVWPCTNGAHLWFYPQCNAQNIFWPHHSVGLVRKPYSRHQTHKSVSILSKNIWIYSLTLHKWRPSWILPPFLNIKCPNKYSWKKYIIWKISVPIFIVLIWKIFFFTKPTINVSK